MEIILRKQEPLLPEQLSTFNKKKRKKERVRTQATREREGARTSIFHDVDERNNGAGDGLERGGGIASPLRVQHLLQRIVQYPATHCFKSKEGRRSG